MLTDKELYMLKELYKDISEMVQLYGSDKHLKVLPLIESQILCIESDKSLEEKTEYLLVSCKTIFSAKNGVSDFGARETNSDLRTKINGMFNKDMQSVWNILKRVYN